MQGVARFYDGDRRKTLGVVQRYTSYSQALKEIYILVERWSIYNAITRDREYFHMSVQNAS